MKWGKFVHYNIYSILHYDWHSPFFSGLGFPLSINVYTIMLITKLLIFLYLHPFFLTHVWTVPTVNMTDQCYFIWKNLVTWLTSKIGTFCMNTSKMVHQILISWKVITAMITWIFTTCMVMSSIMKLQTLLTVKFPIAFFTFMCTFRLDRFC